MSVEINARLMEFQGRKVFFSIIRDISERKRAESELRLHSEILQNMAEGVFMIRTGDWRIVYTNQQVDRMFGYDSGELVGKRVSIVNAPGGKSPEEISEKIFQGLSANGIWQGEVLSIRKDGTTFCAIRILHHMNIRNMEKSGSIYQPGHHRAQAGRRTDKAVSERKRIPSQPDSHKGRCVDAKNNGTERDPRKRTRRHIIFEGQAVCLDQQQDGTNVRIPEKRNHRTDDGTVLSIARKL